MEMYLHLRSFKTPPSGAVMSDEDDADCAFSMRKGVSESINDGLYTILYFCENQDIDDVDIILNRLKIDYPTIVFTRASNDVPDWGQMLTMSNCQHNIIANSSFSWWAAYFNNNPNKIVCYPSTWFGECAGNNTIDLCPSEWKRIEI